MAEHEFRSEAPVVVPDRSIERAETTKGQAGTRKYLDCRTMHAEVPCTLAIAGTEDEVLRAAEDHAVSVHRHQRGPQLTETLRAALRDVPAGESALA